MDVVDPCVHPELVHRRRVQRLRGVLRLRHQRVAVLPQERLLVAEQREEPKPVEPVLSWVLLPQLVRRPLRDVVVPPVSPAREEPLRRVRHRLPADAEVALLLPPVLRPVHTLRPAPATAPPVQRHVAPLLGLPVRLLVGPPLLPRPLLVRVGRGRVQVRTPLVQRVHRARDRWVQMLCVQRHGQKELLRWRRGRVPTDVATAAGGQRRVGPGPEEK